MISERQMTKISELKKAAAARQLSDKEKFQAMDREALATLILALVITAFFWGAIFLLKDTGLMLFSMPAWFTVSCIGGYFLSVAGVIWLVKKVMVEFPLDDEECESAASSEMSEEAVK